MDLLGGDGVYVCVSKKIHPRLASCGVRGRRVGQVREGSSRTVRMGARRMHDCGPTGELGAAGRAVDVLQQLRAALGEDPALSLIHTGGVWSVGGRGAGRSSEA